MASHCVLELFRERPQNFNLHSRFSGNAHDSGKVEFYNLQNDLGEQHDLAGAMPGKTAELKKQLNRWKKQIHAEEPHSKK